MSAKCIAFEGVDGAGKSTVLAHVAQALRQQGVDVYLPRDGKDPQSAAARAIRGLARDPEFLDLGALAEFHLFCARESQMFEQSVRPALARGATVLLDRTLLTAEVIATHTRGVDESEVRDAVRCHPINSVVAQTFVFDVHPKTSRIRKRIGEAMSEPNDDFGRKGLSGTKFKYDLRAGYRFYASKRHYPGVEAERRSPHEIAAEVVARILRPDTPATSDLVARWQIDANTPFAQAVAQLPELEAVYFERGMLCGRARRARLASKYPNYIAWAMDSADPIRETLAPLAPKRCIGGLSGTPLESTNDLRWVYQDQHPEACAMGLRWVTGELADALRIALLKSEPHAVLRSLGGRLDPLGTQLRQHLWKKAPVIARAESLQGLPDDACATQREQLFEEHPTFGLLSLRRCPTGKFDSKLEQYAANAPKLVLAALTGRTDSRARWLRRQLIAHAREVLDSIAFIYEAEEMALRSELAQDWPSEVARSLAGAPAQASLHAEILTACIEAGRGDLHMARQTAFLAERQSRLTPSGDF